MWWPFQWLVIYILGGLTFIPLAIATTIYLAFKYGTTPIGDSDLGKGRKSQLQHEDERSEMAASEEEKDDKKNTGAVKNDEKKNGKPLSGWMTVRRQFSPTSTPISTSSTTSASVDSNGHLEEPEDDEINIKESSKDNKDTKQPTTTTYSARIAQTYRSVMEARQTRKDGIPKEYYFCVLKGSVLFVYEDQEQNEVVAAIGVDKYVVGIEGKEGKFGGKDAEMFAKRNAIVMRLHKGDEDQKDGLPVLGKGVDESEPWFLFSKSNTRMEDFYIALVQASASKPLITDTFAESDMQCLVDTLDAEPDPIPMRWFNAMLGRMFFGVYKTAAVEQLIIDRIMKKLSKVPRPSFLSPIVVREVNVGTSAPYFSKPMLKDLTSDGTASFEVNMHYHSRPNQPNSEVRITIATTATIPTGFKPYVVDLVLAVVLKSIEGNVVVSIKKQPSNRIWWGFTHMPKMEVEIVPIVSERKIQIGMVLKAIEKQLRDVIAESVVLPNIDDIAFFDTSAFEVRGGIFNESFKAKVVKAEVESAEDPSSAIADLPSKKARSNTLDVDGEETEPSPGLPRSETAPALVTSPKKGTNKKWFAPSIVQGSAGSSPLNRSNDSLTLKPTLSAESDINPASSASLPDLGSDATISAPSVTHTAISTEAPSISHHASRSITSSIDAEPLDSSSSSITGTSPTASSLISTIKSRDKKAIQSQVNLARDSLKKWGVNFAAKRRAGLPESSLESKDDDKPAALYRPPDEDGPRRSLDGAPAGAGGRTLQERLAAASAAALAGSNHLSSGGSAPIDVPGRNRSTSSTSSLSGPSRPALHSSPSKSSVQAGTSTSPPQFTVAPSRATTEIVKSSTTSSTSVVSAGSSSHARRESFNIPVQMQPSAGGRMVVPRVPKRPGAVTGMGSSPGEGIIRRISGDDGVRNSQDEGAHTESKEGISSPQAADPVELKRSDSDPLPKVENEVTDPLPIPEITPKSSSIPSSSHNSPPTTTTNLPDISASDDKSPSHSSPSLGGAEDALRKLVQKDEELKDLKAKSLVMAEVEESS